MIEVVLVDREIKDTEKVVHRVYHSIADHLLNVIEDVILYVHTEVSKIVSHLLLRILDVLPSQEELVEILRVAQLCQLCHLLPPLREVLVFT